MQLQVKDVIIEIMGLCGAIEINETPTDAELQLGMRRVNIMLDTLSAKRQFLRSQTQISFPITNPKYIYTIGPGGDVFANKPINVRSAFIRDSSGVDTPVGILTTQEYDSLDDKSFSIAPPEYMSYRPGSAQGSILGTLYFYCIPDQTYTVFLECDVYLTEFVNLTDTVTFEPMYYEALIYNGAKRLWRNYHVNTPIPDDIREIANESMKTISVINVQKVIADLGLPDTKNGNADLFDGWNYNKFMGS